MKKSFIAGILCLLLLHLVFLFSLTGCGQTERQGASKVITDMLGREVEIPQEVERVAGLHHFEGHILYAMGQQDKIVHQSLLGKLGQAMAKVDQNFAALPKVDQGNEINVEMLVSLRPQVVFVYASFEKQMIEQLEKAGIKVVALRGETLEESYEATRIMGRVMGCEDRAEAYINYCQGIVNMIKEKTGGLPEEKRPKVLFCGPKSIYTVATGEMLQSAIVEMAGGRNAAKDVKGFWAEVSPEQIVNWNPDYIFLGSSKDTYSIDKLLSDPAFRLVSAFKDKNIYEFPSNIGWWDYPAPHCVLGIAWTAKTLHPDLFKDMDLKQLADEFYTKFLGYSFTTLGGKL